MHKIYLALGANVGNKNENIKKAVTFLEEKIVDIKTAPIYKTKPFGFTDQDNFLNTAISGYTDLSPHDLLEFVKAIEKRIGRIQRFHWGPREIDIDIIFYNDEIIEMKDLKIPHPGAIQRDFVLKPMVDLDKNLVHPILQKKIQELLENIAQDERSIIGVES